MGKDEILEGATSRLDMLGVRHYGASEPTSPDVDAAVAGLWGGASYPDMKSLVRMPDGSWMPVLMIADDGDGMRRAIEAARAVASHGRAAIAVALRAGGCEAALLSTDDALVPVPLGYSDLSFLAEGAREGLARRISDAVPEGAGAAAAAGAIESGLDGAIDGLERSVADVSARGRLPLVAMSLVASMGYDRDGERVWELLPDELTGTDAARDLGAVCERAGDVLVAAGMGVSVRDALMSEALRRAGRSDVPPGAVRRVCAASQSVVAHMRRGSRLGLSGRLLRRLWGWVDTDEEGRAAIAMTDAWACEAICRLPRLRPGDAVCDPVCGTAGILVAASGIGARVSGIERDPMVLLIGALNMLASSADVSGLVLGDCLDAGIGADVVLMDPPAGDLSALVHAVSCGPRVVVASLDPAGLSSASFADALGHATWLACVRHGGTSIVVLEPGRAHRACDRVIVADADGADPADIRGLVAGSATMTASEAGAVMGRAPDAASVMSALAASARTERVPWELAAFDVSDVAPSGVTGHGPAADAYVRAADSGRVAWLPVSGGDIDWEAMGAYVRAVVDSALAP